MIKFENVEIVGMEASMRGMRNPKNSWALSDSNYEQIDPDGEPVYDFKLGPKDISLAASLAYGGAVHAKYRRMIVVYVDITAPLYWWKEMDTYKVGTVANSCSTMHKLHERDLTIDDFSVDHLLTDSLGVLYQTIHKINAYRNVYVNGGKSRFFEKGDKLVWWQMIQLLPTSYNQKRTWMANYEVLHNIYISRKNHKLDEWRDLCKWIETLPYAKEFICVEENNNGEEV